MTITTPDFFVIGIILLSVLIGIVRGFIKELISLVTWVVAIGLALMYSTNLAEHLTFTKMSTVRNVAAFLLIFVGTVFVGAIFNYLIGGFIRRTPFSAPDRVLGSLFGVLRGMVFVTILLLIGGLTSLPEEPWWKESYSISQFQGLTIWLKEQLPENVAEAFHFPNEPNEEKDTAKNIKGQDKEGSPSSKKKPAVVSKIEM